MSPAAGQVNLSSRRSKLKAFFEDHPGEHRAKDIAAALGDRTQYVANECGRLAKEGVIQRILVPTEGRTTPVVMFRRHPNN